MKPKVEHWTLKPSNAEKNSNPRCLDHRAELFIPELGQTFTCPPTFRIFAAQNPLQQGGGRKGLPKSFLNRFTTVRVEELSHSDLTFIAAASYPEIAPGQLSAMVSFNQVCPLSRTEG